MSDSVSIKGATDKRYPGNPGVLRALPTEKMEISPKEKPAEGKKKGVRSFFGSGWKAAKRLLHRRDPDREVHPTPQPDPEDSDPRPSRYTPTADKDLLVRVCLPGQVCEYVCVPKPPRTKPKLDPNPDPESSPVPDLGDEPWRDLQDHLGEGVPSEALKAIEGSNKRAVAIKERIVIELMNQMKNEQKARYDNVAEFLKLAANADKQQSARIKKVFERKNQRSAQTLQQLQSKLQHYLHTLREEEQNGVPSQPNDVLRDMHQGLKDEGAKVTDVLSQATRSAAEAVVSKPPGPGQLQSSSEDDCSSTTSGSAGANSTAGTTGSSGGPPSSKGNDALEHGQSSSFDALLHEIQELKESLDNLKSDYQRDFTQNMQALQEERSSCERLEEQFYDMTELHRNNIEHLRQEFVSMDERIDYCTSLMTEQELASKDERIDHSTSLTTEPEDIQEALEACQTRTSERELQQQQQQDVWLEGPENDTPCPLIGNLLNVLLAVMAVLVIIAICFPQSSLLDHGFSFF